MRHLLLLSIAFSSITLRAQTNPNRKADNYPAAANEACDSTHYRSYPLGLVSNCHNLKLEVLFPVAANIPCPKNFSRTTKPQEAGECAKISAESDVKSYYTLTRYLVGSDIPCLKGFERSEALDRPGKCESLPLREDNHRRIMLGLKAKIGSGIDCSPGLFRTAPLDRGGFCWKIQLDDNKIPVDPGVSCPNNFTRANADLNVKSDCDRTSKRGMSLLGNGDTAPPAPPTSPTTTDR